MRLSALVEEFLLDCRSRRLSLKTVSWYQNNLRYFLDWLAAEGYPDRLSSLTLSHARRCSQYLSERTARQGTFVPIGVRRGAYALIKSDKPLSANTVAGYLRTLKIFLAGWPPRSRAMPSVTCWRSCSSRGAPRPTRNRSPPRKSGRSSPATTCATRSARDFAILLTYLGTGLRATELTNLLLDDVHVAEGYLRVRAGKGNKTRAVNLPPEAGRAILRYAQHFRPPTKDSHLFVTRSGTALTYNGIKMVMRRARQTSGLDRLHAHLLRHSFSVTALSNGMDLMTLKETLGHADIRTTSGYLSMFEQQLIQQQRKVNLLANVRLPKAIRQKPIGPR